MSVAHGWKCQSELNWEDKKDNLKLELLGQVIWVKLADQMGSVNST